MKVLITGVNGMLGSSIAKALLNTPEYKVAGLARTREYESAAISYHYLDLTDLSELEGALRKISPDTIIHCAANVNVNDCDVRKEYTYNLHVKASDVLSAYASVNRFVYISTDSIYDGKEGNFKETDAPSPANYYAQTKLEGEQAVLRNQKNAIIVRTNIYGVMKPFKSSLAEWAIKSLLNKQTIKGFDDVYFNPLYVGQLAHGVSQLLRSEVSGVINFGSDENISKLAFLKNIASTFKLDESLIERSSITTIPALSNRPRNTTINTQLMQSLQLNYSIGEGINDLYSEYKKLYL